MADWQDHLDNLDKTAVKSARKALDFYDGLQIPWLEETLSCDVGGITDWETRGVKPTYINITKKIVDRSALSYDKPPTRVVTSSGEVNESATETYRDILKAGKFESVMDGADSTSRLLKNVIILAQMVEVVNLPDRVKFNELNRGNCDVDYDFETDSIRSLMYVSAGSSYRGNKLYHYWSADRQVDIERVNGQPEIVGDVSHGYGIIPAAILWDTKQPRTGFWPKEAWEEVIIANEAVNMFFTEMRYSSRYQTYPTLFTDAEVPENTVMAPDTIVSIKKAAGESVYLEYKAATSVNSSLNQFATQMESLESSVAENWGVKISVAGEGTATSGFQLVVEEIPGLQTRNDRLKSAEQYEIDIYAVVLAISNDQNLGLPTDSDVVVDFPEASLPVNKKEDWDILKEKIAMGYLSVEEAYLVENPDMTPDQIAKRKELLATEKTTAAPSFSNVVTNDGN